MERLAERLLRSREDTADASLPPAQILPRHAQVVLIGDFLYPVDEIAARLRRFADMGVKGTVLRPVDPAEDDFPYTGRPRFPALEGRGMRLSPRPAQMPPA